MFRGDFALAQEPAIDAVVLGEGEEAILDIVAAAGNNGSLCKVPGLLLRDGMVLRRTQTRTKPLDLDSLPLPTREPGLTVYNLAASRGCYTTCSFCSVPQFTKGSPGRPFRLRSPASVRAEVTSLKHLGASAISFVDDVFLLPGSKGLRRAMEIADVMEESGIKWSFSCRTPELTEEIIAYCRPRGLCNIGLGIESGSEEVLLRFSKRAGLDHSMRAIRLCRKYGTSIQPYFIMFEPDMSLEDLRLNVLFLNEYGLLWPSYARNALDPHPGTPAFASLIARGRLIERGFDFVPIYSDKQVEAIKNLVRPVLDQARIVEHQLRREQFRAELQSDSHLKQTADSHLTRLSEFTYEFFNRVLCGERPFEKYLDQVRTLATDGREAIGS